MSANRQALEAFINEVRNLSSEDVSRLLQDTARYAGYVDAWVIRQVAKSRKR